MNSSVFVGVAGWSLPRDHVDLFPFHGSHLERYAARFNCVEINSAFYKNHKAATYKRWAETVPENFRFTVKLWRALTHDRRLHVEKTLLQETVGPLLELGPKLGVLLVQLPPGLDLDLDVAENFFSQLRDTVKAPLACEPRHSTWGTADAAALLARHGVTRVQADPEPVPVDTAVFKTPGKIIYHRLHGSPEMYRSRYSRLMLNDLAKELRAEKSRDPRPAYVIFDNTALGHAIPNAFELQEFLKPRTRTTQIERPHRFLREGDTL